MTNNPTFRKISTIIVLLSAVVFVISIIYLVFMKMTVVPIDTFQEKVVMNYMHGDDRVRDNKYAYYNGNNFMELSIEDGAKRPLTKYSFLTNIDAIHWMSNGAVFRFEDTPLSNELQEMIDTQIAKLNTEKESLLIDSPENLYWHVNFTDGTLTFLSYIDNPFDISVDSDGDFIYFHDPLPDDGLHHIGSIDHKGVVTRNIYQASVEIPIPRIIGQSGVMLYILQPSIEDDSKISLQGYNTSTEEHHELIADIYDDTALHTVYDTVDLVDNTLVFTDVDTTSRKVKLTTISLESKERKVLFEGFDSAVTDYVGNGVFRITDSGDTLTRTYSLKVDGSIHNEEIVTRQSYITNQVMFTDSSPILVDRPYIYFESDPHRNIKTVEEKGLEKGYESEHSVLERDILSITGDINNYRLFVSSGSLQEEVARAVEHIKKADIDIYDVTLTPQAAREVIYDLE